MALIFADTHNMIAYLTKSNASEGFNQIIDFGVQAQLIDKKKVIITEAIIWDALRFNDAEGIDCLQNEEIFTELARMGYEKPSTKLTFYKPFLSSQWKVGKGCSGVETLLFEGMIMAPQDGEGAAEVNVDNVSAAGVADESAASIAVDDVGIAQRVDTSDDTVMDDVSKQGRIIADMDADVDVTLKDIALTSATITAASLTLTTAPSAARRRKRVVIRDPE
nr:hypothetical protein [Tanacetum cinerariifolium]